jgi:hypothetical protein
MEEDGPSVKIHISRRSGQVKLAYRLRVVRERVFTRSRNVLCKPACDITSMCMRYESRSSSYNCLSTKIYTLPFHLLHKMSEHMHANRELAQLIQNVNCQHATPLQIPSSGAWLADTNAYKYEKTGVPMKGAYVIMPKLRPRLGRPQTEETRDGRTVNVVPYAHPAPMLKKILVRSSRYET